MKRWEEKPDTRRASVTTVLSDETHYFVELINTNIKGEDYKFAAISASYDLLISQMNTHPWSTFSLFSLIPAFC